MKKHFLFYISKRCIEFHIILNIHTIFYRNNWFVIEISLIIYINNKSYLLIVFWLWNFFDVYRRHIVLVSDWSRCPLYSVFVAVVCRVFIGLLHNKYLKQGYLWQIIQNVNILLRNYRNELELGMWCVVGMKRSTFLCSLLSKFFSFYTKVFPSKENQLWWRIIGTYPVSGKHSLPMDGSLLGNFYVFFLWRYIEEETGKHVTGWKKTCLNYLPVKVFPKCTTYTVERHRICTTVDKRQTEPNDSKDVPKGIVGFFGIWTGMRVIQWLDYRNVWFFH